MEILHELTKREISFSYAQTDLFPCVGFIGRLRADFGSQGTEFWHTWEDYNTEAKTTAFKTEFDKIINALRYNPEYAGMLRSRKDMIRFCKGFPTAAFQGNYTTEYAFRINTQDYVYILRLNPTKGDYNLYCFCYERKRFDRFMSRINGLPEGGQISE